MPFHDVELHTSEMASAFPELVYQRDDPIADISGFGYYAVMKLAREHGVPVVRRDRWRRIVLGYEWVRAAARESYRKARSQEKLLPE